MRLPKIVSVWRNSSRAVPYCDMLAGFVRFRDGSCKPIISVRDLSQAWTDQDARFWVDFEEPTDADLREVRNLIGLDEASLEDCLHGEQRPRIDEFDDYMFIVLYGLVGLDDPSEFNPRKLAAFCGNRFLITVLRFVR